MAQKDLERRPPVQEEPTWIGGRRADFDLVQRGVLNTIEFSFKLPDFDAICIHPFTRAGQVFVELVDDQRGVPVYHDVFNAKLNSYTKSMETCFIFGGVVGGWKMNSENVSELVLGQRNE